MDTKVATDEVLQAMSTAEFVRMMNGELNDLDEAMKAVDRQADRISEMLASRGIASVA